MALLSFTLRKTTVGFGSSLRKAGAADNSLRADGVSTSSIQIVGENEFSANIIDDGQVELSWILADSLVSTASITSGSAAVEIIIVSSISGEPVTINDGLIVTRITDTTNETSYIDTPLVQEGRWVYYTLFVKYSDGIDYWYESGGTLYIQIPIKYDSTDDMWQHTPEHYRLLDYSQTPLSKGLTPLYAFLDLIGDEADRTRTLINSIALSNDPEIAVTPALDQLALETGLEISTTDLGTTKARNLLSSVGYLRQRKGTISSIVSYISAMSGCVVEYEYKSSAPKPHIFHVYSQRQNFISDPNFTQATVSTSTATVSGVKYTLQTTPTWGVYSFGNSASATVVTPTISNTNNGLLIQSPSSATSTRTFLVYPRKTVPYVTTKEYGTSFDVSLSGSGASFNMVHTATNTKRLSWEAGVTGASAAPSPLYQDGAWITQPTFDSTSGSQRYVVRYPSQSGASYSVITSVPVLEFSLTPGSSFFVGQWLWEMGNPGTYFYGGSREGGYIPINTGSVGQGTFDYYWGAAGAGLDYSYYMLDHERVIKTVERVIANSVIPVTMLDSYTIDWNYYIGKP